MRELRPRKINDIGRGGERIYDEKLFSPKELTKDMERKNEVNMRKIEKSKMNELKEGGKRRNNYLE